MVDLVSRPFGNYEVEVFVVCQGVESTPTKLIFEYKSGKLWHRELWHVHMQCHAGGLE